MAYVKQTDGEVDICWVKRRIKKEEKNNQTLCLIANKKKFRRDAAKCSKRRLPTLSNTLILFVIYTPV